MNEGEFTFDPVQCILFLGSESNLLEAVEKNALMDFMENMENITSSVNWLIIYKADMQDKLSDILSWHMKKNDRNAGLR